MNGEDEDGDDDAPAASGCCWGGAALFCCSSPSFDCAFALSLLNMMLRGRQAEEAEKLACAPSSAKSFSRLGASSEEQSLSSYIVMSQPWYYESVPKRNQASAPHRIRSTAELSSPSSSSSPSCW